VIVTAEAALPEAWVLTAGQKSSVDQPDFLAAELEVFVAGRNVLDVPKY
jgi:hypothetical protein